MNMFINKKPVEDRMITVNRTGFTSFSLPFAS